MAYDVKKLKERDEVVLVPPVDIYENEESYVLRCEIPGVTKDSMEVTLKNNELEISARVAPEEITRENMVYSEYVLNNYNRKFVVDDNVDSTGITANLENGILTLTLPKSERIKPRKIEISFEK